MTDGACPSDDDLLRFADGALADAQRGPLEDHLDQCDPCRIALSTLAPERVTADEHLGRYRVDGVLGGGGMGVVLRGHDPELDRPVALKLVRARGDDAELRARLRREARALARLNHPNVCQVYDVGDDGAETYLAMELVDGVTLRGHLATAPSSTALLAIIAAAGRGLAAAHAAGVIHRDVKPDNLLIARAGRVVVSDFGLAGAAAAATDDDDGAAPPMTRAVGTLGYAAPEQLLGGPVDARADQFGLCATAWEVLTGQRPFDADTIGAQILAIGRGPAGRPPVGRAVAAALRRGLAAAPDERFPSMTALVAALTPRPARAFALVAAAGAVVVVAAMVAVRPWRASSSPGPAARAAQDGGATSEVAVAATAPAGIDAGQPTPSPTATPPTPTPPATAPAPGRPPRVVPSPTATARRAPGRSTAALDAAVATWCHLPVDPRQPEPALAAWHRADWGPIAQVERATITDSFTGAARDVDLIEVRGVAGTRRVMRTAEALPSVGALAIVCDNSAVPADEIEQVPASWRAALRMPSLVAVIARPPRITAKATLAPVHVNAADLAAAARAGQWPWPPGVNVVARVVVGADLGGGRFTIGDATSGWIVEVPTRTPGATAIAAGAAAWIVVAEPRFDGGRLIVTARDAEARYVAAP